MKKKNNRNIKDANITAFVQSITLDGIALANKKQLGNMIHYLNVECGISYNKISKMCNDKPISTLQRLAKPPKQDNTQETNQMIRNGLDYDVLAKHFEVYIPTDEEEVLFARIAEAILKKEERAREQRTINNSNKTKTNTGTEGDSNLFDINLRRAIASLKPFNNLTVEYDTHRMSLLVELKNIVNKLIIVVQGTEK